MTTNQFGYNALGTRVSKTDSAGQKIYRRDGVYVTDPVLADGAATYTPGVSERRAGVSKHYHSDYLGSTRLLTGAHSLPTDTKTYDAFGNPVSSTGSTPTPFTFAGAWGYQSDADTGLQLLGHRYYDPSLGRFLVRDPARSGSNFMTYGANNPVGCVDPTGLDPSATRAWIPDGGQYWDGYYNTIDTSNPMGWEESFGNFFGGMGDVISFGATAAIRDQLGCDEIVDRRSGLYRLGTYCGLAHTVASGAAGGWISAAKRPGTEFSHAITAAAINKTGSKFLSRLGRTRWNGNYISPLLHSKIDPYRFIKGFTRASKYPVALRVVLRIPRVYIGGAIGWAYGRLHVPE